MSYGNNPEEQAQINEENMIREIWEGLGESGQRALLWWGGHSDLSDRRPIPPEGFPVLVSSGLVTKDSDGFAAYTSLGRAVAEYGRDHG